MALMEPFLQINEDRTGKADKAAMRAAQAWCSSSLSLCPPCVSEGLTEHCAFTALSLPV